MALVWPKIEAWCTKKVHAISRLVTSKDEKITVGAKKYCHGEGFGEVNAIPLKQGRRQRVDGHDEWFH